jgi:aspartate/methionine/tyrosine aminotransferase
VSQFARLDRLPPYVFATVNEIKMEARRAGNDIGIEFFSLSKSYSMPGWRVGFCVGNQETVFALRRIKSYLDYGIFQPI